MPEGEHPDLPGPVQPGLVLVLPGLPLDAEPGQDARRVQDLALGVAGVQTRCVQLQQLATVVLVGMLILGLPVVQVGQHRRVRRDGREQIREAPEGMAPDGPRIVGPRFGDVVAGAGDVEVVSPEVLHHGEQLTFAPQGTDGEPGQNRHLLLPPGAAVGVDQVAHVPDVLGLVRQAAQHGITGTVVDACRIQL